MKSVRLGRTWCLASKTIEVCGVTAPILATGWQPSVFDADGSVAKEFSCNAGDRDLDSIPGLGRFPGEGNSNPLQCSCLENTVDGGAWQVTVHGVAKSQTQLSKKIKK